MPKTFEERFGRSLGSTPVGPRPEDAEEIRKEEDSRRPEEITPEMAWKQGEAPIQEEPKAVESPDEAKKRTEKALEEAAKVERDAKAEAERLKK